MYVLRDNHSLQLVPCSKYVIPADGDLQDILARHNNQKCHITACNIIPSIIAQLMFSQMVHILPQKTVRVD